MLQLAKEGTGKRAWLKGGTMAEIFDRSEVKLLASMLTASKSTVFFGGAGVSTESGVPDFRSASGIYTKVRHAEEILTPRFLQNEAENFYDFYRKYFILDDIRPNACHYGLAELERRGLLQAVVTQNVDHLHQEAGSQNVIELHGTGHRFFCKSCARFYSVDEVKKTRGVPRCDCGGVLRPDIVLYEESLPERAIHSAIQAIEHADLLIIGGTSLAVYPAAGLVHYQALRGKKVLIDLSAQMSTSVDLTIRAPIGQVFSDLLEELDGDAKIDEPIRR